MTSDDGPAGGLPAVDHAVVAGSDLGESIDGGDVHTHTSGRR